MLWVNAIAVVVYATFVAAILVADIWIFPKIGALSPPPEQVGVAIRQAQDVEGLREMAQILYDHVTDQAQKVNELVSSMVFWTRLHFLFTLGLASFNVIMLVRMRRVSEAGENTESVR